MRAALAVVDTAALLETEKMTPQYEGARRHVHLNCIHGGCTISIMVVVRRE